MWCWGRAHAKYANACFSEHLRHLRAQDICDCASLLYCTGCMLHVAVDRIFPKHQERLVSVKFGASKSMLLVGAV